MNQKCLGKVEKVTDVLDSVVVALDHLKDAIVEDNEEAANRALDGMPTDKNIRKAIEDLGLLLRARPWEGKVRKHA